MAESGAVPSVGSAGDSYDNAPAETIIGLSELEAAYDRQQHERARAA